MLTKEERLQSFGMALAVAHRFRQLEGMGLLKSRAMWADETGRLVRSAYRPNIPLDAVVLKLSVDPPDSSTSD